MSRAAKIPLIFYLFGLVCFLDFALTLVLIDFEVNPIVRFLVEVYGPMVFALAYYCAIVFVIFVGLISSKFRFLYRVYFYCLIFLLVFKILAVFVNVFNLLSSFRVVSCLGVCFKLCLS